MEESDRILDRIVWAAVSKIPAGNLEIGETIWKFLLIPKPVTPLDMKVGIQCLDIDCDNSPLNDLVFGAKCEDWNLGEIGIRVADHLIWDFLEGCGREVFTLDEKNEKNGK